MATTLKLLTMGIVIIGAAGLLLGWPTSRHLALFAAMYSVPVTAANRQMLAMYIWWSRVWRFGGGAAGLIAAALIDRLTAVDSGDSWLLPMGLGYGLGAVAGELARPRPRSNGQRRAALADRRVTDYVRPWLLRAIAVMSIASLANVAAYYRVTTSRRSDFERLYLHSPVAVLTVTIVAVVLAGVAFSVARHVARRPQPAESMEFEAVHHAIRSAAVMSLLGAALLLAGVATSISANSVALLDVDQSEWIRWAHNVVAMAAGVSILVGFMLSIRSIPRWAPFWRRLPTVPPTAELS